MDRRGGAINPEHAEHVARLIRSDRLALTHADTLQRLYLCRVNEKHLERQLAKEREENARLRKTTTPVFKDHKLLCGHCGWELERIPYTKRPRFPYCPKCGVKQREQAK